MKVLKNILNTVINILIVLILIVSVLIAVLALTSKASGGLSRIFGYTIENVQTDSMKGGSEDYPGGDFSKGDVVIGKYTDFAYDEEFEEGDIVTFMEIIEEVDAEKKQPVCHRIIEVAEYQGVRCYRTQGDNSPGADQDAGDYASYIRGDDIGSVFYSDDYHGLVIPGLGNVLDFLQSKLGFFLVVLLPMAIFFLYELIRVIFNAANYRAEKTMEAKKDEEDRQKARQAEIDAAVAEALRKRDQEDQTAPSDDSEDQEFDAPQMTAEEYEQFKQFQAFKKMQEQENKE